MGVGALGLEDLGGSVRMGAFFDNNGSDFFLMIYFQRKIHRMSQIILGFHIGMEA